MIFFLLFLCFTLFFVLIGTLLTRNKRPIVRRLQQYIQIDQVSREQSTTILNRKQPESKSIKNMIQIVSKSFKGKRVEDKWQQLLEEAGLPIKPEEFQTIRILSLLAGLLTVFLLSMNIFVSSMIVLIGWLAPLFYLKSKRKKRILACSNQLPQALGTLGTALKSGFSFMQAMQMVAKEIGDPLGVEFEKTIREINLGISTENAFHNLLQRLPNNDLKLVVTAVIIQRSTGGNLAKLFEMIEDTINERVRIKDELKALTSQGKMSALIISLLPVVLGVLLNVISPEYFSPMLHHPLGLVLLAMGTLSGIIGWFVIQKIVKIEV